MKSLAILCAKDVVIDQRTNSTSIFSILEQIQSSEFPFLLNPLVVFSFSEKEEKDTAKVECKLTIKLGSKILGENDALLVDFADGKRNRLMVNIAGLVIPAPGTLTFEISCFGKKLHAYEVVVDQAKKPKIVV